MGSNRIPAPPSDHLTSYRHFIDHLNDREFFGQKLGLERIQHLLRSLGDPHTQYKIIHIAGTNGKGSTAAMIHAILLASGYRVGLYTSPHLVDFCERIRIQDEDITQDRVMALAKRVHSQGSENLTFFEMATAIAFLAFAESHCEWVVLETGLGGRLDATNVVTPEVSVITSIGLDHQQFLGNTLGKIALEKAGIIKKGVPLVLGPMPEEAETVIRSEVKKLSSPLYSVTQKSEMPLPLLGDHQQWNAAIALQVVAVLRDKNNLIPEDAVQKGLKAVRWPGRLEYVSKKPKILLDGAHNEDGAYALLKYLEGESLKNSIQLIVSFMADKPYLSFLKILAPVVHSLHFVPLAMKRALSAEAFEKEVRPLFPALRVHASLSEMQNWISEKDQEGDLWVVAGSLYGVGEWKKLIHVKDDAI